MKSIEEMSRHRRRLLGHVHCLPLMLELEHLGRALEEIVPVLRVAREVIEGFHPTGQLLPGSDDVLEGIG